MSADEDSKRTSQISTAMQFISRSSDGEDPIVESMSLEQIWGELRQLQPYMDQERRDQLNLRYESLIKSIGSTSVDADVAAAKDGVSVFEEQPSYTYIPLDLNVASLKNLATEGTLPAWIRLSELAQADTVWSYVLSNIQRDYNVAKKEKDSTKSAISRLVQWWWIVSNLITPDRVDIPANSRKNITDLLDQYAVLLYNRLESRLKQLETEIRKESSGFARSPDMVVKKIQQWRSVHSEVDQSDLVVGERLTNVANSLQSISQQVGERSDITVEQLTDLRLLQKAKEKARAQASERDESNEPVMVVAPSDDAQRSQLEAEARERSSFWLKVIFGSLAAVVLVGIVLVVVAIIRDERRKKKSTQTETTPPKTIQPALL